MRSPSIPLRGLVLISWAQLAYDFDRSARRLVFRAADLHRVRISRVDEDRQALNPSHSYCLSSPFREALWVGEELLMMYNDGAQSLLLYSIGQLIRRRLHGDSGRQASLASRHGRSDRMGRSVLHLTCFGLILTITRSYGTSSSLRHCECSRAKRSRASTRAIDHSVLDRPHLIYQRRTAVHGSSVRNWRDATRGDVRDLVLASLRY